MKFSINRAMKLGWPFLVLFVLTLIIVRERMGIGQVQSGIPHMEEYRERIWNVSDADFSTQTANGRECLIIADMRDEQSAVFLADMEFLLDSMKTGYDIWDMEKGDKPDFGQYEKIVVTLSQMELLGDPVIELCDWVERGGQLMNTGTFSGDTYAGILLTKAGVINTADMSFTNVSGMRAMEGFMLNAGGRSFTYDIPSPTALEVALLPECRVYMEDSASDLPLLWEKEYGSGRFVIINQVLTSKINRGMLCAAYSLLGEACLYPVINGSSFYLDDFPAPVPEGNSAFITQRYGVSIASFYSNIWWPDILELEEKYGIVHTGMIIEQYSDVVEPPFPENETTERFEFFGNMLLNNNGELGFHGYNHMPLWLAEGEIGEPEEDYVRWPSTDAMADGLRELGTFAAELFPKEVFTVYVPPSNSLSVEGRRLIKERLPDIKVISSTYFEGESAYTQEFKVAEDGIVEAPRITSGCDVDEYMMLSAFSEMNFHYVQSHFLHPDDVLDEDRGAALGWETLYERLGAYIDYIYDTAPDIRNLTGSAMGQAVREYDMVTVQRRIADGRLVAELGGFYEDAYFMLRADGKNPQMMSDGELTRLTDSLFLVHAVEDKVEILLD